MKEQCEEIINFTVPNSLSETVYKGMFYHFTLLERNIIDTIFAVRLMAQEVESSLLNFKDVHENHRFSQQNFLKTMLLVFLQDYYEYPKTFPQI